MKKKRRKATIVPPLGPPTNLRPAGAHKSKRLYDRNKMKAIFRKDEDGFRFCRYTYNAPGVTDRCTNRHRLTAKILTLIDENAAKP